jgi:DNA-binding response OmpR family regulator
MATIILVEDDVMLAEIYQTRLELAGHSCKVAHDGLDGLLLIKQELPDLVLLDLMLPQMSGDEILREMRKSDWGKDIKAVFLTNISESEAPDGLDQLKFERYIVKANLTNNQLAEVVDEILHKQPEKTGA